MRKKISKNTIQDFLKTVPRFADLKVLDVESGVSTDVFQLVGAQKGYFLRLTPDGENIWAEVLIHNRALQAGVSVPRCVYYEDFNPVLSRSFMITTSMPGLPVTDLQSGKQEVVQQAGKDLARLHSIKVKGFGWFDVSTPEVTELVGKFTSYSAFIFEELDLLGRLKYLQQSELLDGALCDKMHRYLITHTNSFDSLSPVIAHCDLSNEHIFCVEDNYSGIIDFGDASAMSRYYDLAKYSLNEPKDYPHLLAGYQDINPLPSNYPDLIQLEATVVAIRTLFWKAKNMPETLKSNREYFDFLNREFG